MKTITVTRKPKIILISILTIVLAVTGGLYAIELLGSSSYDLDAFTIGVAVNFSPSGSTTIAIPPIGEVQADTHKPPVNLTLSLENIELEKLEPWLSEETSNQQILSALQERLEGVFWSFLLKTSLLAFLGGILIMLVLSSKRSWKVILLAGFLPLLIWVSIVSASVATYDKDAFQEPSYTGVISAAPWMTGIVQEAPDKIKRFGEQMALLAENLQRLVNRLDYLEPLGLPDADLTLLVVSDIHNNPGALDFVENIVETFNPDLIIDAGDITDWGTPYESQQFLRIETWNKPYLFVPGNHDSPQVVESLSEIDSMFIFSGCSTVDVHGLTVMGCADPGSLTESPASASLEQIQAQIKEATALIETTKPDIFVSHHPAIADGLIDQVPLVISGHSHQWRITETDKGHLHLNPGSTGAAGIRGLQSENEIPYSLMLVYLKDTPEGWQTTATDLIQVYSLDSELILKRKVFD